MVYMWPIIFALGLGGGILVNYLSDVLPRWRSLSVPRCLHCEKPNTTWELYLFQRRCPHCEQVRPHRGRAIITLIALLGTTIWMWISPAPKIGFWLGYPVSILFYLIVVIDIEHRLILQPVSLVGAGLSLLVGWQLHGLQSTLIGGLVGFGIMFVLYKFGEVFTKIVSRMRSEELDEVALGFGDVNLGGVLGLLLGWPVITLGLILAILAGGGFSLVFMVVSLVFGRYRSFEAMPYAPFLIIAAGLIIFFPDTAKTILGGLSPLMGAALGGP